MNSNASTDSHFHSVRLDSPDKIDSAGMGNYKQKILIQTIATYDGLSHSYGQNLYTLRKY